MLTVWDTPIIVDIETVLTILGSQMTEKTGLQYFGRPVPSGSNLMVKCPFHKNGQERRPSMGLRVDTGQFNCFTCGEEDGNQGDFPMFIAKCLDLGVERDSEGKIVKPPKPELGYKWLLHNFNLAVQGERPSLGLGQDRGKRNVFTNFVSEDDLEQYMEYEHPYMLEERFIPQKIQDYLQIGYDKSTHSVTFIMRDLKGRAVYVKKRPISSYNDVRYANEKDIPKKHLMFGAFWIYRDLVRNRKEWITKAANENGFWIVEGEIDCASGWTLRCPTASIGGRVLFVEQTRVMSQIGMRKVILGLDNDEEGQKETERILATYSNQFRFKVAQYPSWAKDMNDVVKQGKDLSVIKIV